MGSLRFKPAITYLIIYKNKKNYYFYIVKNKNLIIYFKRKRSQIHTNMVLHTKSTETYDYTADVHPSKTNPDCDNLRTIRLHVEEDNKDTYWFLQVYVCHEINKIYIISSSGCSFEMVSSGGYMSSEFHYECFDETIEKYTDDPTEDNLVWSIICVDILNTFGIENPEIIYENSHEQLTKDMKEYAKNIHKSSYNLRLPPLNLVKDVIPNITKCITPKWLINPSIILSYTIDFKTLLDNTVLPWTLFTDMSSEI